MLEYTTACLDRVIESGRMDLVEDLATPVPALVTMELLGLPLDLWQWCAHASHRLSYTPAGADAGAAWADFSAMLDAVGEAVEELRVRPQGGIVGRLLAEGIEGQPVSDDDLRNICQGLIIGGVDTTGSLTSQTLLYLHRNHRARQQLIDDPDMVPVATEEFLRHFTPSLALARTVTRDTELGGQPMKAGDRVLLMWDGANHDPVEFATPDDIVLDRFPNRHIAFGVGLHRCIGSNLARGEFTTILREVLRRIPDFEIDESATEGYPSIGVMQGNIAMPATFTPGRREGTVDLPAPRPH